MNERSGKHQPGLRGRRPHHVVGLALLDLGLQGLDLLLGLLQLVDALAGRTLVLVQLTLLLLHEALEAEDGRSSALRGELAWNCWKGTPSLKIQMAR